MNINTLLFLSCLFISLGANAKILDQKTTTVSLTIYPKILPNEYRNIIKRKQSTKTYIYKQENNSVINYHSSTLQNTMQNKSDKASNKTLVVISEKNGTFIISAY